MLTFINNLFGKIESLPKWLSYPVNILLFITAFFIIPSLSVWIMSFFFWSSPWLFISMLFLIPAGAYTLEKFYRRNPPEIRQAKNLRRIILVFYTIVSVTVGLNVSTIRDFLGYKFIPKYYIEYQEGSDSYGNTAYFPDISTSDWYFTLLAHVVVPMLHVFLIALFVLLYSLVSGIVQSSKNSENLIQDKINFDD